MDSRLQELMRDAARLTQAGRLQDATALLQGALAGGTQPAQPPRADAAAAGPFRGAPEAWSAWLDPASHRGRPAPPHDARAAGGADVWDLDASQVVEVESPAEETDPVGAATPPRSEGGFVQGSHTGASLTRAFKLFIPPQAGQAASLPLVVMLHGCKQDPDDFAAGTGMNALAQEQGFFVLYPAQGHDANPSGCWNWFKHNHQERGRGEPALIASMTQAVMREHRIDPARVYVAGLSAGGAMAAIVGAAYPELFAAVGVHSGLAPGAARSLPEALAAMNGAAPGLARQSGSNPSPTAGPVLPQPVIVFHGDMDKTVHPRNGEQVVAAALGEASDAGTAEVNRGVSAHGRRYTRSVHRGGPGGAVVEHWLVHGAGHAWAGGQAAGSYTDTQGPDASREMLRFFLEHPRGGRA